MDGKLTELQELTDLVFTDREGLASGGLAAALTGKATVVVGEPDVGKTTLVQALLGRWRGARPGQVSGTKTGELHAAPGETWLVDTPGIRDLGFQVEALPREEAGEAAPAESIEETVEALPKAQEPDEAAPADYRYTACLETFTCQVCGAEVAPEGAGSQHRNHCPHCLSSVHVDVEPGDRASDCHGVMEPISVWSRKGGEWALIHRCRRCGALSSNRVAGDDNPALLVSIAARPLADPPFPLSQLGRMLGQN